MPHTQGRSTIKKMLEFYEALGVESLPVNASELKAISDALDSTVPANAPSVPKTMPSSSAMVMKTDRRHIPKAKSLAMDELRLKLGDCHRCRLSSGRTNIVFGEGNPDSRLMFIGEGPGRDEDAQGRPFVGEAGQLLARMIGKMGFRREDVYIANIVKCRPPENRTPEDDEIAHCLPFVVEQIRIAAPTVVMALGRVAAHALLGIKTPISRLRGNIHYFEDIPVMPTFHPAYLLRNPKDKVLVWDDALKVLELMGRQPV